MRMLSGRPEELNPAANFLTDAIELRSNSIASIFAVGFPLIIASLTSRPAVIFLTPITTWTPRKARTRAVSVPIPLDAPARTGQQDDKVTYHKCSLKRNGHQVTYYLNCFPH
jgi:hypothetical protein